MRSFFNNAAVAHHDNAVGLLDGSQAVGDDDAGPAVHQAFQCLLNQPFGFIIQRAGGFVEQQDGCVFQDGACNGNTLPLAA